MSGGGGGEQKRVEEVKERVLFLTHSTFYPSRFSLSPPVSPVLPRLRRLKEDIRTKEYGVIGG